MISADLVDPRWKRVFELFNEQKFRHLGVRASALVALELLRSQPLRYVGDPSPNNLISAAPQWMDNGSEYDDALLWEDITYGNIEYLAVMDKGTLRKGAFSLGRVIACS